MQLWPHQIETYNAIDNAWAGGARNVMAVLPTGSGKTFLFTKLMRDLRAPCVAIAHRQELVGQISVALAKHGVRHRIIGQTKSIRLIIRKHMDETGGTFYEPTSDVAVASVDTLVRRERQLGHWLQIVQLWVQDEGHHILRANKWGRAASMFPSARGLAVTATPYRADGRGLSRDSDGLIDTMVVGQSMREVINAGYLTDYRVFCPQTKDLDLSGVKIGASGDYSKKQLGLAVSRSRVIGDVVEHYQRIAPGKLGITFATNVNLAGEIASAYNAAGVRAEVVSHKTDDTTRDAILRRFKAREILQLVNCDLFGEGFDLPAVECVSMARPTQSFSLYAQQFGRGLRIMDGKPYAVIIDHVGNVMRHGLPDARRQWSLDRREKRKASDPDLIPVRTCARCTLAYERIHKACPYCGFTPVPAERSGPEFVDGDLLELDADTLSRMRGAVEQIDKDPQQYRRELLGTHLPPRYAERNVRELVATQRAQHELRESIALWAGHRRAAGVGDSTSYRRFYFRYGLDVLSAQALPRDRALELTKRIQQDINGGMLS